MSDISSKNETGSASETNHLMHSSAGAMLRKAREDAGLHIAALAVSLKVPVKKIEALEGDRLDLLPDAVFARALASSVCRALKIDAKQILSALPQSRQNSLDTLNRPSSVSFRDSGQNMQRAVWAQMPRPFVIIGLALVAGALLLFIYPSVEQLVRADDKLTERVPPTNSVVSPTALSPQKLPSNLGVAEIPLIATVPSLNSTPIAPELVSSDASRPGNQVVESSAIAIASGQVMSLKSKGDSWIEVTDAGGVVQARKTMSRGETLSVGGLLPLKVVVGRADSVDVLVRDQPLNLTFFTKENIARFEVK